MNSSQKQEAQEAASQLVKDFLGWFKKQGSTGILYRGLADKRWEVSSSLYRRLLNGKCVDEESQTDVEIYQIHREANEKIIKGAKHQGYHREFGVLLNTLQTFAKL